MTGADLKANNPSTVIVIKTMELDLLKSHYGTS